EEKRKNADVLMQSRIINTLTENFIDVYMVDLETRNVSPIRVASHAINFESDYASYAPYREIIKKYINENVYEKDQAEMLMATKLDTIKNALSRTPNYYFHYRELAGEEEIHYYYMQASRLGNADDFKKIVVGFACEDEEKLKEKLLVDRLMAVEGLSKEFAYVCCINIRKEKSEDEATPIYSNGRVERILPEWTDTKHFSKMLDLIWERLVVDEDKDHFYAATRRETILSQITLMEFYYVNFRVQSDGEIHYAQIQFSKAETGDEGIFSVIAAFHYVDSQVNEQIMQREKLESALSLAESASKAKTSFLFNMSHDIRTPMNAILGFTKIAKGHIDDIDRVKDSLDKIEASGQQLLDLINDILEMSRIESGKIEITTEPALITRVIDNIGPMLNSLAIAKSQELKVEFGEIKDNYVWLDAVHLNRVLVNMITNAIKYTRDGGKVFVCVNQISEAVDGVANYSFSVTDTGIGMSEEFMTHLFEEFSREKTSTESKQQGTGLGLAIAKRIVDNMGGTIDVISKLGQGSTFTVTLPLRVQTAEEIDNNYKYADMTATLDEQDTLKGAKVLLVEDNELNREIACELLGEMGMIVDCAEDGQFALDKVKEMYGFADKSEYYDFVLMDIQMPVMDGYTSCQEIRKYEAEVNGHLPIIAMTANAFAEDKQKAYDVGMDAHVAKPIDLDALKQTLIAFKK
ncbi:MAG: ATP-binding protein, partial [Clostridia bacterium]|nr:ATP-binding protein [Clostridia bacterium]